MIFTVNNQHTSRALLQRLDDNNNYAEVCPVAQAISELFGTPASVCHTEIDVGKLMFQTSNKLERMIVDYDSGAKFQEGKYEAELVSING